MGLSPIDSLASLSTLLRSICTWEDLSLTQAEFFLKTTEMSFLLIPLEILLIYSKPDFLSCLAVFWGRLHMDILRSFSLESWITLMLNLAIKLLDLFLSILSFPEILLLRLKGLIPCSNLQFCRLSLCLVFWDIFLRYLSTCLRADLGQFLKFKVKRRKLRNRTLIIFSYN